MDSGREASGTMLIPTRFVWASGGTTVYLSGSFNRWADLIPMTTLEGCPTVFQAICKVSPGYHQYKFVVDGEWRHDEHQPYVAGEYGIVNTILLASDPYHVPQVIKPEVPIPDAPLPEAMPRILEEHLQVSRHRISVFMSTCTVYELLPESGKVVALDVELPVKQAFHILYEQGICMAPLWDFSKGQFVGVLGASDFILILRELGNHGSNLTEEELETHTISAWKEGKAYLNGQIDGHGRALSRPLIHAGPHDNFKDVALKILHNKVTTVPIIQSSSEDGSFPQLLHLASLSGILKCICRYFRHCSNSLPILHLPISKIPVGTWVPKIGGSNGRPLAMLKSTASLSTALNLLVEVQVSSIPIVDDNDSLLDIYSRSDITALAKDRAYTHINVNEMTVHQALQLGQDSSSPYELTSQRCQMCLRTDPLYKVMQRLSTPGVRRLVIVEAGSKRVEGIVSLSDIFKLLLG